MTQNNNAADELSDLTGRDREEFEGEYEMPDFHDQELKTMTDELCDHVEGLEWHRKEITTAGTTHHLRCQECGGEWSFETDHTFSEAATVLNRQIRLLGHEILRAVGLR